MAESVISLQGVELAFGEKKVLQGVDLEVKGDHGGHRAVGYR